MHELRLPVLRSARACEFDPIDERNDAIAGPCAASISRLKPGSFADVCEMEYRSLALWFKVPHRDSEFEDRGANQCLDTE
jgi:hypothetical protein